MKAKDIIEKFKDKYGYVKDIDQVINYLNEHCEDLKQINEILFVIYEWNKKIYESLHIKQKQNFSTRKKETLEKDENERIKVEQDNTHIFDVSEYMSQIETCSDLDFITDILPSRYDSNFENIILSILLEMYQELKSANEMIRVCKNEEEIGYLLKEIARYKKIITIIKDYNEEELNEEELNDTDEEIEYIPDNVVYLTNDQEIPFVLNDLNDINTADYEDALKLLKTVLNGKITREKRFHNSEDLTEISAVRKRDIRIIFTRGQNNTFIILGIFPKRVQNTTIYRDFIKRRARIYKEKKKEIKEKIKITNYHQENKEVTITTLNLLTSKKAKKKNITGDSNGTNA